MFALDKKKKILVFLLTLSLISLYMNYRSKENIEPERTRMDDVDASEMCRTISSQADNITATFDGYKNLVDSSWAFLSPSNYASGDNKTDDTLRNVIMNDMSDEDIKKIETECTTSNVTTQENILDNSDCEACKINPALCKYDGILQENIMNDKQNCVLNSAIDILSNKTTNIDAQALAEALQKAQGILSGNNDAKKNLCNIVKQDMSSYDYMEKTSKCRSNSTHSQKNAILGCGQYTNITQRNSYDGYLDCLIAENIVKKTDMDSTIKTSLTAKTDQTSVGLDLLASCGSIISIAVIGIVVFIIFMAIKEG